MRKIRLRIFFIFCSQVVIGCCFAGPPFGTDDPEPVGFRHWEYYLSSMHQVQPGFATGTLPHFEINYGVIPNCQIHAEVPMNYNLIQNKEFQYGYSYTELGFKYRFFQSKDKTFEAGTFPIVEIPTVKNKNFGNNKTQIYLPLWVQKSAGKITTYGGGGYWINQGTGNKNWLFAGWELQYDVSRHFTFGGELMYKTSQTINGHPFAGFNLGGFVNFSEKFHFIYSVGHSITHDKTTMAYAGLLITI